LKITVIVSMHFSSIRTRVKDSGKAYSRLATLEQYMVISLPITHYDCPKKPRLIYVWRGGSEEETCAWVPLYSR
jgi:hypothetical protein